jgi:hypothetical protein
VSQDTFEVYRQQADTGADARAATAYVTDRSSADSTALDAAVNSLVETHGRTSIFVHCRMSVAAATVALVAVLYDEDATPIGIAAPGAQTATATSYRTDGSGDYWTQVLIFDAGAADSYEVRMAAPSSGTVDIRTWVA